MVIGGRYIEAVMNGAGGANEAEELSAHHPKVTETSLTARAMLGSMGWIATHPNQTNDDVYGSNIVVPFSLASPFFFFQYGSGFL